MKFFSNDPNGSGLELHDTAEAARLAAVSAIDAEREIAVSEREWSDDVDSIFWGQVIECAEEFDNDDEHHADYRLGSVAEPMVPLRLVEEIAIAFQAAPRGGHDEMSRWYWSIDAAIRAAREGER